MVERRQQSALPNKIRHISVVPVKRLVEPLNSHLNHQSPKAR